ncbi:hypothetical protein CDD82_1903 [Ophiocordyceps australis]|uniref:Rad21/Rec8-like protein N-terminal domain-containing protein n=1 Tax=Ophiocordyceps australis TaxID=1399860 RepID=A0A2C5Y1K3_9HYPO|nr:hypothetical protein CDD82_1903 [Ophiocordyceps australis]
MFYSETLLNKTGPLAQAWLSANLERKLSKNHILQCNVSDSVEAIMTPNQAPMALRLSSQLLLGIVKIYRRKTRYLLEDCNEILVRVKMMVRSSGNNDMAVNSQMPNPEALTLPNKIGPGDNLEVPPPPDASWLLSQDDDLTVTPVVGRKGRVTSNREINLQEDFDNSQFLQGSKGFEEDALAPMDDLELELDFGLDIDGGISQSIDQGRDGPAPREPDDDVISEIGLMPQAELATAKDESRAFDFGNDAVIIHDADGDIAMGVDELSFNPGDQSAVPDMTEAMANLERARISESPLSDIDEELAREVEAEYARHNQTDLYEPQEDVEASVVRRPTQRAKKQKVLMPDGDIALSSTLIKQQQADRKNVIRSTNFLEPMGLNEVPRGSGGGVLSSSVVLGSKSALWPCGYQVLLSAEEMSINELKRKRDSGVADVESDQGAHKSPRLESGDDTDMMRDGDEIGHQSAMAADGTVLDFADGNENGLERDMGSPLPEFDETTAPLVHPAESGPVSIATKHAVHILRDLFGPEAATDEEKRNKSSVVFQNLLPEQRTSKADATKMFFECLVLATKDAIKVQQGPGLGDAIRVRGKRGLWGAWAEHDAGGELSSQDNDPEPAAVSAPAVAVGA